jgi:hypothetical protein
MSKKKRQGIHQDPAATFLEYRYYLPAGPRRSCSEVKESWERKHEHWLLVFRLQESGGYKRTSYSRITPLRDDLWAKAGLTSEQPSWHSILALSVDAEDSISD